MNITDKKAQAILDKIGMSELSESVEEYPENERDERTDMQFVADEISYFVSNYRESGHVYADDLAYARRIIRETKNGTVIPLIVVNLVPIRPRYTASDITNARNTIAEYNRLCKALYSLNRKGYHGKWQ